MSPHDEFAAKDLEDSQEGDTSRISHSEATGAEVSADSPLAKLQVNSSPTSPRHLRRPSSQLHSDLPPLVNRRSSGRLAAINLHSQTVLLPEVQSSFNDLTQASPPVKTGQVQARRSSIRLAAMSKRPNPSEQRSMSGSYTVFEPGQDLGQAPSASSASKKQSDARGAAKPALLMKRAFKSAKDGHNHRSAVNYPSVLEKPTRMAPKCSGRATRVVKSIARKTLPPQRPQHAHSAVQMGSRTNPLLKSKVGIGLSNQSMTSEPGLMQSYETTAAPMSYAKTVAYPKSKGHIASPRPSANSISEGGTKASPGRLSARHKGGREVSRDASASSSLSPFEQTSPPPARVSAGKKASGPAVSDDIDSSDEEHQPPPAPAVPHLLTFGDDPWEHPDPTIYEIRNATADMSEEEKKQIYSVADYPHDDLHDLIPGTPPDGNYTKPKPANQVQPTTFATYIEPYMRPLAEEDLAFLRDGGDRVSDFTIPPLGKRHYTEIWAEEDGLPLSDQARQTRDKLPTDEPRGSIEDLDENIAETDDISVGPMLERLLSLLRPEHRAPPSDQNSVANTNTDGNADLDSSLGLDPMQLDPRAAPLPPATYMPESASEGWKKANHPKLDHSQIDERIKQEFRYLGFLKENKKPGYDKSFDDEIAASIRCLEALLKEQTIMVRARKAIILDSSKETMAHQEYSTILHDLDSQVQTSFLKRTRTMGKKTKAKRPGGAGGGSHAAAQGMARPGIGDATKILMERRKKWIENIEPVFEGHTSTVPRAHDEGSSIFSPEKMAEFVQRERERWDEEAEEE